MVPSYRVGGKGGFYYIDANNNLFVFHDENVVGPAPLAGLYALESGGAPPPPPAPARRLRSLLAAWAGSWAAPARRSLHAAADDTSFEIVSTATDGTVVWVVLGNG